MVTVTCSVLRAAVALLVLHTRHLLNNCFCSFLDDVATGSLPLVNISASVSLSAADMTMYLKKMSRGEAVEGNCLTAAAVSHV